MGSMKKTLDISDQLPVRTKRDANKSGHSFSVVTEERLRQVPDTPVPRSCNRLSDLSVGNPDSADPMERYSWQDLRDIIYGHPGAE